MSPDTKITIDRLVQAGFSGRKIAKALGLPKSTVNDYLKGRREVLSKGKAKILLYDIETAPAISYTWGRWQQNVGQSQVIQDSFMLTWSAKWLGDSVVHTDSIHRHHSGAECGKHQNDFEIVCSLYDMLCEADIIIHQNGDRFDFPTLNARLAYHGLRPVSPTKMVDTLKIARSQFRFPANRLDSLASYLGIDQRKIKTDFDLWARCMRGEVDAFEEMVRYNEQDVHVLEQVYLRLRPWDTRHPNVALFDDSEEMSCVACGSHNLTLSDKPATTGVSKFDCYVCDDCGKINRGRKNTLTKAKRESLLTNVVR